MTGSGLAVLTQMRISPRRVSRLRRAAVRGFLRGGDLAACNTLVTTEPKTEARFFELLEITLFT